MTWFLFHFVYSEDVKRKEKNFYIIILIQMTITLSDLEIGSLDLNYIERLEERTWLSRYDVDLSDYINLDSQCPNFDLTNGIIYWLMSEYIENSEASEEDKELLRDNIYLNCLDSRIDCSLEDLESEEGKDL